MKITYQQALEAQLVLLELDNLVLQVKSAVALARLSNMIDGELKTYDKVRRNLLKDYSIVVSHREETNLFDVSAPSLTMSNDEKEAHLRDFTEKFQELLETELPEWNGDKIMLPEDLTFTSKRLKSVADFVEVG